MNILLIDDEPEVLDSISEALNLIGFPNKKFTNPEDAINKYNLEDFDVVITDIRMPEMSGIEVLKSIKSHNPAAKVIILTGYSDVNDAIEAVNNGAYAFFQKPLDTESFMDTLSEIEEELKGIDEIIGNIQNVREILNLSDSWLIGSELFKSAGKSITGLKNINSLLIDIQSQSDEYFIKSVEFMAKAIEARDKYTSGHVGRVTAYTLAIVSKLDWNQKKIEQAYLGTLLHDIGKIGISDTILNKQGFLNDKEFEIVKAHVTIGVNILKGLPRFEKFIDYILYHHERYDGRGYPNGLKGEEIPIEGRIVCVADSFDSMTSDRPYRKAHNMKDAVVELIKCSGTYFDPNIVEVFIAMLQSGSMVSSSRN